MEGWAWMERKEGIDGGKTWDGRMGLVTGGCYGWDGRIGEDGRKRPRWKDRPPPVLQEVVLHLICYEINRCFDRRNDI